MKDNNSNRNEDRIEAKVKKTGGASVDDGNVTADGSGSE